MEDVKNLHSFFEKENSMQIEIIENILKSDEYHKFTNFREFTISDIAVSTLQAMQLYVFNNDKNSIGVIDDNSIRICFQPSANHKDSLEKTIVYFAHIISQDYNGERVYSKSKSKSIQYWSLILNSPEKIYSQNSLNKISIAFERQIPSNKSGETSFIVLYLEEVDCNLFRVITVLPDQNFKQIKRKKEKNSIVELSSFLELHDFISQSVKDRDGNKCDSDSKSNTNIQINYELPNNSENKMEDGGSVPSKIKVLVHNNTNSVSDKEAQNVILQYLKHLNDSGKKHLVKFIQKSGQSLSDYETIFYLNKNYHPNHSDKWYSNKIRYKKTIEEAYVDASEDDDESPSFIRVLVKDRVINYVAITQFDLFGDYTGDMYDEKGYLKEEVKSNAISSLKAELSFNRVSDKMAEGGEVSKPSVSEIKEAVEKKLQSQQSNKEFKDVGRVAQTRKEKSAFKLISGQLLTTLEEDSVMAYNMVKKENVWAEIDVNAERERGVTSGAAYLKVKIREAVPTRPKDEKAKRATYVLFLEMLQKDLLECYTVKNIEDLKTKYKNLPMNEIIGYFLNPEFLTADDERKKLIEEELKRTTTVFRYGFMYSGGMLVPKLINEVFGAKFENALFNKSDASHIVWNEAKEKEPITEEESKSALEILLDKKNKFIEANNKLIEETKALSKEELLNSMNTKWTINPENRKVYKENPESFREWVISYYERRIRMENEVWNRKEKALQPKSNDWSWFETPKTKSVSEIPKAKAINTKVPLSFIKRTGGYKIDINTPTEIVEKFGFSAVNYGVYVDDKWSREHTKHFLGAISDLGEMLNIDIKALNQLGKLSIAFGAKGRKGHLATYFPQTKDINLTKGKGDGSVAHEWGHYFDNVIIELDEQLATNKFASQDQMLDYEVKILFKELMTFFYKGNDLFTPKVPVNFYAKKADEASKFTKHINGSWESGEIVIKPTIEETLEQLSHLFVVDPNIYTTQLRLIGYVIAQFGLDSYSIPCKIKTSYFYHKSAYNWFQYCYKIEKKIGEVYIPKVEIVVSNRTPYWTSAVELFARAWETVVLKKILDKGRVSNYLVDDISIEDIVRESWANPYPSGKELDYIEVMIDKIIVAVKKKFSIGDFIPPSIIIEDEYIDLTKDGKVEQEVMIETAPTGEKEVEYVKEQSPEELEAISTLEMLIGLGGSEEQITEWKDTLERFKTLA